MIKLLSFFYINLIITKNQLKKMSYELLKQIAVGIGSITGDTGEDALHVKLDLENRGSGNVSDINETLRVTIATDDVNLASMNTNIQSLASVVDDGSLLVTLTEPVTNSYDIGNSDNFTQRVVIASDDPNLVNVNANLSTANTTLSTISGNASSIASSTSTTATNVSTVNTTLGTTNSTLSDIGIDIEAIDTKILTTNTNLSTINTSIGTGNASLSSMDTKLSTTNTYIDLSNTNLDKIDLKLGVSNTNTSATATNVSTVNTTLGTTNTNLTTINTSIGTGNTSLSSVDSKLTTSNTNTSNTATNISTVNTTLGTTNSNLSTINTSVGTGNTSLSSIDSKISTTNTNLSTINTSIGSGNTSLATLAGGVTSSKYNCNIAQLGGLTPNLQAGNVESATLRVTVATDDVNLAAINSNTTGIYGDTTNVYTETLKANDFIYRAQYASSGMLGGRITDLSNSTFVNLVNTNVSGGYLFDLPSNTINLVSSSANDTAAGTGARTVKVYGYNGNGDGINETITMAGTSLSSASSNTYYGIWKLEVITVGSGNKNAGYIYAVNAGNTEKYQVIKDTNNVSGNPIWPIPKNSTVQCRSLTIQNIDSSNAIIRVVHKTRTMSKILFTCNSLLASNILIDLSMLENQYHNVSNEAHAISLEGESLAVMTNGTLSANLGIYLFSPPT
jgi:trimeric autotransporter adhesin